MYHAINTSCQLRPLPNCYLPLNVIHSHLDTFYEFGASSITSTKWASLINFTKIGRSANDYDINGVQWVSPYNAQTEILDNCSNANCVLSVLGIEINTHDMFNDNWGNPTRINRVMQVNVYNRSLMELNLRIRVNKERVHYGDLVVIQ